MTAFVLALVLAADPDPRPMSVHEIWHPGGEARPLPYVAPSDLPICRTVMTPDGCSVELLKTCRNDPSLWTCRSAPGVRRCEPKCPDVPRA